MRWLLIAMCEEKKYTSFEFYRIGLLCFDIISAKLCYVRILVISFK